MTATVVLHPLAPPAEWPPASIHPPKPRSWQEPSRTGQDHQEWWRDGQIPRSSRVTSCHFLSSVLSPFSEHPKNAKDGSRHHSEHFLGDWSTPFHTTQELGDFWQSSIPVMVTKGLFNQGLSFRMFCNRNLHFFKKQQEPKLNSFHSPSVVFIQTFTHLASDPQSYATSFFLKHKLASNWGFCKIGQARRIHRRKYEFPQVEREMNSSRYHLGKLKTYANGLGDLSLKVPGQKIDVIHDMTDMIHDVFLYKLTHF